MRRCLHCGGAILARYGAAQCINCARPAMTRGERLRLVKALAEDAASRAASRAERQARAYRGHRTRRANAAARPAH